MDYEEKYNEALERARKAYNSISDENLAVKKMLEDAFPELRESEDERIRKRLITLIRILDSSFFTGNNPSKEQCLAYLEKQKGCLTDNKTSADEDERIRKHIVKFIDEQYPTHGNLKKEKDKMLAYLEKQKESLHIKETCKENADSFTDEDERMVKDIRLALLSVDDAFWATHSLTAKEAIAWLEKQKEQPTNEGMLRTLRVEYEKGVADTIAKYEQKEQKEIPLMNGDADLYFDEWNQQNQNPTKRQCFEEGMRYAQKLQKDVKVKYVYPKFRIGDIISNNKPEPGFINDYTIVGFNNELPDYLVDGGNVPSCSIGIEFIDSNYRLKEQKPADLSEMMVHKEPYIAPVPTPMVADEQKPVEWSEEDEKLFWGFTAYVPNEELERLGVTRFDILKKLKSIRPQPIQLKEAYKDGFQTARHATALTFMNYLDENRPDGKMGLSNGECEDIDKAFKENDWAKIMRYVEKYSPQPKVELSEDVKKTLDEVSHILVGLNYKQIAKDYKQAIEELLYSRPSWKPSEEQMEALRVTIDFMPDTFKPRCTLITLQNGLEKLM